MMLVSYYQILFGVKNTVISEVGKRTNMKPLCKHVMS